MTTADDVRSPDNGVILVDTPCINCNYNLRGCSRAAECPECGSPVADSGIGVILVNADDRWRRRVQLGLTLILVGLVLVVVASVLTVLVALTVPGFPSGWWRISTVRGAGPIAVTVWTAWTLLWVHFGLAIFLLTAREPRTRFDEGPLCLRRIVRVSPLLLLPVTTVNFGAFLKVGGLSWVNGSWVGLLPGACCILLLVAVGLYLGKLGEQWRLAKLARASRVTTLFLGITLSISVVLQPLAALLGWKNIAEGPLWDYGVLQAPAALACLCYVCLLIQYKRSFS